MLKLAQKRPLESDFSNGGIPPCSPHKITTLDSDSPVKRYKQVRESSISTKPLSHFDSPFTTHSMETNDMDLSKFIPRRKMKSEVSIIQQTDRLFTYEEVQQIVTRALEERDATLKAHYDQILQQGLQEQFKSFAKFNEDYISQQIKQNELSYLS